MNGSVFNPLESTEEIQEEYFRFFLTSFAPNNEDFQRELKDSIPLEYLMRGPYISISPFFKQGRLFHEYEKERVSEEVKKSFGNIERLYQHQEEAITKILNGKNVIAAVPTGSGKTEIFMIPIVQYCYEHRGEPGVKAILIYPMNALAKDQVDRLRKILWKLNKSLEEGGVTFAIYTGDTPENVNELKDFETRSENCFLSEEEMEKFDCPVYCDRNQIKYSSEDQNLYCSLNSNVSFPYQILTREEIRNNPPDIIITNYVQLEHILMRKKDADWLTNTVKFLVLDEIHTYTGSKGIDIAFLMRRLRDRIGNDVICIGTSATLSSFQDPTERKQRIAKFASDIFGSTFTLDSVVEASLETLEFPDSVKITKLEEIPEVEDIEKISEEGFKSIIQKINPHIQFNPKEERGKLLTNTLLSNPFFKVLVSELNTPLSLHELSDRLKSNTEIRNLVEGISQDNLEKIVWSYLKIATKAINPKNPSLPFVSINVHNFFKIIERLYRCSNCGKIYHSPKDSCNECKHSVDEIGVCRFCGQEYAIVNTSMEYFLNWYHKKVDSKKKKRLLGDFEVSQTVTGLKKLSYTSEYELNSIPIWTSQAIPEEFENFYIQNKCLKCGSLMDETVDECIFCKSKELRKVAVFIGNIKEYEFEGKKRIKKSTQPTNCPFCGNSYGRYSALSNISMSSDTASTVVFDKVYGLLPEKFRKLLIFTDNRQIASYLAKKLEDTHRPYDPYINIQNCK